MTLRLQLLVVSLSLLILPWATFVFVVELDRNLRESLLVSSDSQISAVADTLAGYPDWQGQRVRPISKTLLAAELDSAILLDGYAHDWSSVELQARHFDYSHNKVLLDDEESPAASSFDMQVAMRNGRLYLYVRVKDDKLIYHRSSRRAVATGDNIIIRVLSDDNTIRRYTFRWSAPGETVGRYYGPQFEGERPVLEDREYRATMVESTAGYNVELRIPEPREGLFGLSVVDIDELAGAELWTGMFDPDERDDIGQLKYLDQKVSSLLAGYTRPGMRMRVFDTRGWLIADSDQRMPDAEVREFEAINANLFDALVYRFIAWSLERELAANVLPVIDDGLLNDPEFKLFERLSGKEEFLRDRYGRIFRSSVQAIESSGKIAGYLFVQQPRASLTSFTETAILKLVKIFGLAFLLVAFVLIVFASWLSYRIRKLRDGIENAVAGDGQITGQFKVSAATDEIGDLSRSFHHIIRRLSGYTGYLQSLGSRLSHELRTPLSVVTTSLENIDRNVLNEHSRTAIDRAGQGAARLQQLIRNLSEATSIEQTITRSEKCVVDLRDWIVVARELYDSTYANRRIALYLQGRESALVFASVDLLHQMMDKLMSNAVDFSPQNSTITLGLRCERGLVVVTVENTGSHLPPALGSELFSAMVTEREVRDDQPHMGLGLYIVRLIAEHHNATVTADNIPGHHAVRFSVVFQAE
ncbi:hypothetical protein AB833_20230 [Chromatiales bacterium (ex Bugula neritina AB1)]|nr:hypothetical protein AB833_20230 [Chromatiales bacterium (ex Bugula neritina AB1)]